MSRTSLCVLLCLTFGYCQSQDPIPDSIMNMYKRAENHCFALENENAEIVLDSILYILQENHLNTSSFGIKVILKKAYAQDLGNKVELAFKSFKEALQIATQNNDYTALADTYISLSLLYEKNQDFEEAFEYLDSANLYITKFKIISLKPKYFIRLASVFRVSKLYGQSDSAFYYANKGLKFATEQKNTTRITSGNLVLGLLYSNQKNGFKKAKFHFHKAIIAYEKLNNFDSRINIYYNLTKLHLKNDFIDAALLYSDSSIITAQISSKNSIYRDLADYWYIYKVRSQIFEKKRQLDSALVCLKTFHRYKINFEQKKATIGVAQEKVKYNNEKYKRKIKKQAQIIEKEEQIIHEKNNIILVLILFFSALIYLYIRLKNATNKTRQLTQKIQLINKELNISLKEKKTLLKEVHHRIKNNLQIVISMLEWYAIDESNPMIKQNYKALVNRVNSIASIHELMYSKDELKDIGLQDYIFTLCNYIKKSVSDESLQFDIKCEELKFNMPTLIPIGILINELITNSVKHGKVAGKVLNISIEVARQANDYFLLLYQDNGKGLPDSETLKKSKSMGWYLIKSMPRQLQGNVKMYNDSGAVFEILFKAQE